MIGNCCYAALSHEVSTPTKLDLSITQRNVHKITKMGRLLRFVPRPLYRSMAQSHIAEAHRKGFDSWSQLVAMGFAQLSSVRSLCTLCGGFHSGRAALYHLGCADCPLHAQ